jgi:LmbE family N-acetylglucosaminyl deacetylase
VLGLSILKTGPRPSILCLGAHSDDIEIGCGGTILRLIECLPSAHVDWVVFSSTAVRRQEAVRSAKLFLRRARSKSITVHAFRDGFFPYMGMKIKQEFERLKKRVDPDIVFTHYRKDLHQDHRVLNELTWNTFRNHMILEYEIPKFDGDLGTPNLFVSLDDQTRKKKAEYLDSVFQTQREKYWFSGGTFEALMRLRGVEARSSTGFAEAFHARKINLHL